ncbi:MAG: hypothetical protein ACPL7B_17465, partial [Candidatus Poribacteria bacterium]
VDYRYKFLSPRVLMKDKDTGKSINCLSIRQNWWHLWNVSPKRSPYPQWDFRSNGILYGRDVKFLVVLTVLQNGQSYDLKIRPIGNIDGIEVVNGEKVRQIYFDK